MFNFILFAVIIYDLHPYHLVIKKCISQYSALPFQKAKYVPTISPFWHWWPQVFRKSCYHKIYANTKEIKNLSFISFKCIDVQRNNFTFRNIATLHAQNTLDKKTASLAGKFSFFFTLYVVEENKESYFCLN